MTLEWRYITEEDVKADSFTENKIQAVAAITADNGTVSAVSVSAPVPDRNGENTKELKLICQNSARKKILRAFGQDVSCKAKGEDTFYCNG